MAQPYKKVGRGGAGNFYSKKDMQDVVKNASAGDLESQTQIPPSVDLTRALTSSQPAPEYLHTGRGGAGNWIQPSDLTSRGLTQISSSPNSSTSTSTSTSTSPSSPNTSSPTTTPPSIPAPVPGIRTSKRVLGGGGGGSTAAKAPYRSGRGGAGNYVDFAEEERLRREEEERARREAEERVVRDVEAGLARPARAYGGRGGAWEMGDMN